MSHTYVSCYMHYIFSTKGRIPYLTAEIRPRLWSYMGGIARQKGMSALAIGGDIEHTHALISLPATISIASGIQLIKGPSSKWIHETIPSLQQFAWQEGYAAFSVSYNSLANVKAYIQQQEEHHRKHTFQEEFIAFLQKYHMPYDERYLWDDASRFIGS